MADALRFMAFLTACRESDSNTPYINVPTLARHYREDASRFHRRGREGLQETQYVAGLFKKVDGIPWLRLCPSNRLESMEESWHEPVAVVF